MGSYLAFALSSTLFELGDWEESGRVVDEALEHGGLSRFRLHETKGQLEVGRGDFPTAREHLELAVRLCPGPFEASWPLTSLVELAIWEERYDDARNLLDRAMDVLEPLDPEEVSPPTDLARIPAVGLRLEADRADLARAARSAAGVQEARRRAEPLLAVLRAMAALAADGGDAWAPCFVALGEAEWSRLEGRPDPLLWRQAAECWERIEMAYGAAYARFREARHSSPPGPHGPGPSLLSGPRTAPLSRSGRCHCAARSSCWPAADASTSVSRPPRPRRPRHLHHRSPGSA
jgi:tetratricopeptide (TPR) repeat protein